VSLTLRKGHRLKVFGNRVLRRIFGPKRDEVTGEWRKLHSENFFVVITVPKGLNRWRHAEMVSKIHKAKQSHYTS
jgi:hypothetical protein